MNKIYLDNAATTPLLPEVIEAMNHVMINNFGNPSSIHEKGRKAKSLIEASRRSISREFGCSLGELFFTSGATESNNTVLYSLSLSQSIERIISSPTEHPGVLNALKFIEKNNWAEVEYLKVDSLGRIDPTELEGKLKNSKKKTLVSIMYANNEIGTVQDIRAIGRITKEHSALFHTDAVQAIGHFKLNFEDLGIDYLTMSAHKFHGPKGAGILFMSNESIFPSLIKGGSQERNMRAGTENVIGIVGMSKAIELSYANIDSWSSHISSLKNHLQESLLGWRDDITINGSIGSKDLYTILNVFLPDHPKSELLTMLLDIEGICVSGGSACSSGTVAASHVLEAIHPGNSRYGVRFSFAHSNTIDEINHTVQIIKKIYS